MNNRTRDVYIPILHGPSPTAIEDTVKLLQANSQNPQPEQKPAPVYLRFRLSGPSFHPTLRLKVTEIVRKNEDSFEVFCEGTVDGPTTLVTTNGHEYTLRHEEYYNYKLTYNPELRRGRINYITIGKKAPP